MELLLAIEVYQEFETKVGMHPFWMLQAVYLFRDSHMPEENYRDIYKWSLSSFVSTI